MMQTLDVRVCNIGMLMHLKMFTFLSLTVPVFNLHQNCPSGLEKLRIFAILSNGHLGSSEVVGFGTNRKRMSRAISSHNEQYTKLVQSCTRL